MSNENQETIADIVREMRTLGRLDEKSTDKIPRSLQALGLRTYADRIEAAAMRDADSIHRAMVLIAGIEMEDSNNPPRLWTALEDAYNALSDALGTDGEITADLEEAKVIGRHFVIKPYGNAAKMREMFDSKIKEIESMKDAPLDGCFGHQEINGNKLCAKLDFYEFAKRILRGDAVKEEK